MAAKQTEIFGNSTEIIDVSTKPKKILLFNDKRKSGKDYVTDILYKRCVAKITYSLHHNRACRQFATNLSLNRYKLCSVFAADLQQLPDKLGSQKSIIIRLSGPIKTHWAKLLNLDLNQLLGNGKYKEEYRSAMSEWGEKIRAQNYGYFCRAAIDMYDAKDKPVWIISDVRRKTDIQWFKENYGDICKTIRIICTDEVRQKRGWIYTLGIDDAETECGLDDVNTWDILLENNDDSNIETTLQQLLDLID